MIPFLFIVLSATFFFLWRFKRRRLVHLASLTPTMKGGIPILGHAFTLYGNSEQLWNTIKEIIKETNRTGGVLGVWVGPTLNYVITDPEDAITVLNKCLDKNRYIYGMATNFLRDSLINAGGSKWKRNRKTFNPSFSQHMLDHYRVIFNTQVRSLVKNMEPLAGKGETSLFSQLSDSTINTMCITVLGMSKTKKLVVDQHYKHAQKEMFSILAKRFANIFFHPDITFNMSRLRKEEDTVVNIVHTQAANAVTQRKREREEEANDSKTALGHKFQSFLDLLLDLRENEKLEEHEIKDELNGIISAGFDTQATGLLYTLMLIGSYPHVQEKLYNEIMATVGPDNDFNNHHELPYLDAVFKESLRLYPPVPIISRDCHEEIQLKNFKIPAGCSCSVAIWGIQRLPLWGPDADEFRPERWLEPESLPKNPGVYCSFSLGRRNCIGKHYGTLFSKTALVHIVRRFYIKADMMKMRFKLEVLLKPVSEDLLTLQLR